MKVVKDIVSLQENINFFRKKELSIGFVPTMGALHEGHLSLIEDANRCDVVICSIFVNPTQFNDKNDYKNYPRDLAQDIEKIEKSTCDILFCPEEKEILNYIRLPQINLGTIETIFEGKFRDNHFEGVAKIVGIFFKLINPDYAFFGLKDYQQYLIVKKIVMQLALKVEIVGVPTVRHTNGLAMSSRNKLLKPENKNLASNIFKALGYIKDNMNVYPSFDILKDKAIKTYLSNNKIEIEYFEICNVDTLNVLKEKTGAEMIVLIAVKLDGIRLIDNLIV